METKRFTLHDSFIRECPISPEQLEAHKRAFKKAGGKVQKIPEGVTADGFKTLRQLNKLSGDRLRDGQ